MSQRAKKKAETTSYSASEELYQTLFEQAAGGMFIANGQGRYVTFEYHHKTKVGRLIPVEVNANYLEYEKQKFHTRMRAGKY